MDLKSFPRELIAYIFRFLDPKSLATMERVSKQDKIFIDIYHLWKQLVEDKNIHCLENQESSYYKNIFRLKFSLKNNKDLKIPFDKSISFYESDIHTLLAENYDYFKNDVTKRGWIKCNQFLWNNNIYIPVINFSSIIDEALFNVYDKKMKRHLKSIKKGLPLNFSNFLEEIRENGGRKKLFENPDNILNSFANLNDRELCRIVWVTYLNQQKKNLNIPVEEVDTYVKKSALLAKQTMENESLYSKLINNEKLPAISIAIFGFLFGGILFGLLARSSGTYEKTPSSSGAILAGLSSILTALTFVSGYLLLRILYTRTINKRNNPDAAFIIEKADTLLESKKPISSSRHSPFYSKVSSSFFSRSKNTSIPDLEDGLYEKTTLLNNPPR